MGRWGVERSTSDTLTDTVIETVEVAEAVPYLWLHGRQAIGGSQLLTTQAGCSDAHQTIQSTVLNSKWVDTRMIAK